MLNISSVIALGFLGSLHCSVQAASLCAPAETTFFNCEVSGSGKLLSVCGSLKGQQFLQYRFGSLNKIELTFPKTKAGSFPKFSWVQDVRKTAGTTTYGLAFSQSSYKYVVSATTYPLNEEPNPKFSKFGGVSVSSSSGKISEISCASPPIEQLATLDSHMEHR